MKTRFIRKAYNAVEPMQVDAHNNSTGPFGSANGYQQRRSMAFAAFEDLSSVSHSRKGSEEWVSPRSDSVEALSSPSQSASIGGRARRLSIATRGINVTTEVVESNEDPLTAATTFTHSHGPSRAHPSRSRAGSIFSPSAPHLPQKRRQPEGRANHSINQSATVARKIEPEVTEVKQQHHPNSASTPSLLTSSTAPLPPSDQLSPELLGLLRAFRQAVEHAIVEGVETTQTTSSTSPTGPQKGSPSGLALPKYVGAELNQACNDVIRYVTQFLKHKKDEFEELLVRHVRWGQPTSTESEAQRAEREGPVHLASIYCILEALLVASGCDRAILYIVNPATNQLVGIAYAGTQVPIEVPVLVPIAIKKEESRTGGPEHRLVHPAVVSYLNCAGINIANLQDCPPELAVEAYDNLTGYATRNMLCVPIRDCSGIGTREVPRQVSTMSPSATDRKHSVSAIRNAMFEDDGAGEESDPQVAGIGVLQLINKHRTAPSRHPREDLPEDNEPHMPFSERDEISATHAAGQIATILSWAEHAKVDFLSTSACKHSSQLQHMHAGIRQRSRGENAGFSDAQDNPTVILNKKLAGGAVLHTHTGHRQAKIMQSKRDQAIREEVRAGICGDVLDAVEASVIKSTAEGLRYGSAREGPSVDKTPTKKSVSAHDRRSGNNVLHSPKAAMTKHMATATEMVRAFSDKVFSARRGVPLATHKEGNAKGFRPKAPATVDDAPLVIHRICSSKLTMADDDDVVGGLIAGNKLSGQSQPTIVEAAQAIGHLKGAWKHVHAQLSAANEKLIQCQRQLEAERLRCRALEGTCRRAGIDSVAEEALEKNLAPNLEKDGKAPMDRSSASLSEGFNPFSFSKESTEKDVVPKRATSPYPLVPTHTLL